MTTMGAHHITAFLHLHLPVFGAGRISLSGNLMVTERKWRAAASPD
jgi:hypothetical protein